VRADGKSLSLTFNGLEIRCSSTSVLLETEKADPDRVTFADVIAGLDFVWFFTVIGVADYGSDTFWTLLWDSPAYVPIPFLFKPYGNADPTEAQPHFSGFVVIDQKPPLGGDAGAAWWTFGSRLTCTARPERLTDAGVLL